MADPHVTLDPELTDTEMTDSLLIKESFVNRRYLYITDSWQRAPTRIRISLVN